jgi:hypothetical protein
MGVSVQATNRFLANHAVKLYDFDPDGVNPVDVAWVPFHSFFGLVVGFFRTIGTGAVDGFKISRTRRRTARARRPSSLRARRPARRGGRPGLARGHGRGGPPGVHRRRLVPAAVSANVEFATATDEGVVLHPGPALRQDGLTADVVA